MFQWYSRSAVCYAFLPDVEGIDGELLELAKYGHLENDEYDRFNSSQLTRSKWFTRGWTLQELLAPQKIDFFGCDWTNLGTRDTLSCYISITTRIPKRALGAHSATILNMYSIAERMSWAAKRETTRIEDTAYCLLGIFGVSMSLIYGEAEKAFARLQEEIIKISSDHSIFVWDRSIHLDPVNDSRILASGPKQFHSERRIVQCSSFQFLETPYSISNVGLSIELPISTTSQGRLFCVLGCAYEDEPNGPIGVFLNALDSAKNIYTFLGSFVVNFEEANQAKSNRKGLIMNHSVRMYLSRELGLFRPSKYNMRSKIVIETERNIEHRFPEQYWNKHRKVLCYPESTSGVGAFSLRMECGYYIALFDIDTTTKGFEFPIYWIFAFYVPTIRNFRAVIREKLKQLSEEPLVPETKECSCFWNREMVSFSISALDKWREWHKIEVKWTSLAQPPLADKTSERQVLETQKEIGPRWQN